MFVSDKHADQIHVSPLITLTKDETIVVKVEHVLADLEG